ncbi:hypothetical protein B0H19DRAFT_1105731 [Mycena capillaripes]|nr:hypothetical protein B0H19DRAFT_1105731 [Mycena capillaripes]
MGGFVQAPLTITSVYTSPVRQTNTIIQYRIRMEVIERAALAFQDRWVLERPNKTLNTFNPDSPQPQSLLFHATRSTHLRRFKEGGVYPPVTNNELSTRQAFYLSNSLANSVAHALTYQHVPNPRDKPIVVFVFVVDSDIMLNLSNEIKTKISLRWLCRLCRVPEILQVCSRKLSTNGRRQRRRRRGMERFHRRSHLFAACEAGRRYCGKP